MKFDSSAYKITILLYLSVILLPIALYFSYSSFQEIESNRATISKLTSNVTSMLLLKEINNQSKIQQMTREIDTQFGHLRPWMRKNNDNKFYVGSDPLLKSYDALVKCWKNNQQNITIECLKKFKALMFSLDNMIRLKQERIFNFFYLNLLIVMALLLVLVFLVRIYIHKQLKAKSIYDLNTKLFTKDYLLVVLEEIIAHDARSIDNLTVLYIDVEDLKKHKEDTKIQENKILKHIGESLLSSIRVSDIASRYSHNEFIVILQNTHEQNIDPVINRINENLMGLEYTTKVIEHAYHETYKHLRAKLDTVTSNVKHK